MQDGTYLSRNSATLGPLTSQPPCVGRLTGRCRIQLDRLESSVGGLGGDGRRAHPPFIPSPDAHILFLLFDWEKDASGRYEHKTLINLMKSSSPWLLPGDGAVDRR